MGKKLVLISAILLAVGAAFTLLNHHEAEAKVCFVNDSSCGGATISSTTPGVNTCINAGYTCTGSLDNCTSPVLSLTNTSGCATGSGSNIDTSGCWKKVSCPINGNYFMKCPKAYKLSCPAPYETHGTCGNLKGCNCPTSYKYTLALTTNSNPDNIKTVPDASISTNVLHCTASGPACAPIAGDGSYETDSWAMKYPICICSAPYLYTSNTNTPQPANTEPYTGSGNVDNDYCVDSNGNKYYKGWNCSFQHYHETSLTCAPYAPDDNDKCFNYEDQTWYYASCQDCRNFPATNLNYVTNGLSSGINVPNTEGCLSNGECMSNFTASTYTYTNNNSAATTFTKYTLRFKKETSPILGGSSFKDAEPEYVMYYGDSDPEDDYIGPDYNASTDAWWGEEWPRYTYIQCPYATANGENRYYIVKCNEPGMRPSTTSDLKEDGTPYRSGEACVPDSCDNVVKTILRTDSTLSDQYGLFYPAGVKTTSGPNGNKAYMIDGNGKPIIERYVNTKQGGAIQTSGEDYGLTWNTNDKMWIQSSDIIVSQNNLTTKKGWRLVGNVGTSSVNKPTRKTAIVLNAQDYDSTTGTEDGYIVVSRVDDYEQRFISCTRQVCMPKNGAKNYYRVTRRDNSVPVAQNAGEINSYSASGQCFIAGQYSPNTQFTGLPTNCGAHCPNNCVPTVTEPNDPIYHEPITGGGITGAWLGNNLNILKKILSHDVLEAIIPSAYADSNPNDEWEYHINVCRKRTDWPDLPFWKFSPSDDEIDKGNYDDNDDLQAATGYSYQLDKPICGAWGYPDGGEEACAMCFGKMKYMDCYNCNNVTASMRNNCLSADTEIEQTTKMKLQPQSSNFCVQTGTLQYSTINYVGLKGVPADRYISINEFYNYVSNTFNGQYKELYINMMERSCKRGIKSINNEAQNPKIKYVSNQYFPANVTGLNTEVDPNVALSEGNTSETLPTLEFTGIDIEFTGSGEVQIVRPMVFQSGTITAASNTNLTIDPYRSVTIPTNTGLAGDTTIMVFSPSSTIMNSTIISRKGDMRMYSINMENTNVQFCKNMEIGDPGHSINNTLVNNLTSDNGSSITKLAGCTQSSTLSIYASTVSDGYKYSLDHLNVDAGNAFGGYTGSDNIPYLTYAHGNTNDARLVAFIGSYNGGDTSENDITVASTMDLQGNILFSNIKADTLFLLVGVPSSTVNLSNSNTDTSEPCHYIGNVRSTVVNMMDYNKLVVSNIGSFQIQAPAAIGNLMRTKDASGNTESTDCTKTDIELSGNNSNGLIHANAIKAKVSIRFCTNHDSDNPAMNMGLCFNSRYVVKNGGNISLVPAFSALSLTNFTKPYGNHEWGVGTPTQIATTYVPADLCEMNYAGVPSSRYSQLEEDLQHLPGRQLRYQRTSSNGKWNYRVITGTYTTLTTVTWGFASNGLTIEPATPLMTKGVYIIGKGSSCENVNDNVINFGIDDTY